MGREIPCLEATPTRPRSSSNNCRDLGVNRRLRSRAWSLRRTAAFAGCWLYLGTNCLARRSTASVVKTRPRRDDDDFFMRAFDYTMHYSHPMQPAINKDALFVLRKNMQEINVLLQTECPKRRVALSYFSSPEEEQRESSHPKGIDFGQGLHASGNHCMIVCLASLGSNRSSHPVMLASRSGERP